MKGNLMMRKILLVFLVCGFLVPGYGFANGWEANLNAGTDSVLGGIAYKRDLNAGYMKTGVSGLYTEDGNMEYKWAEFQFVVGSETLSPGLTCEVGLNGLLGDAEDNGYSGDVGALAFTGYVGYLFPKRVMPIPFEVFGGLTYSPEVLSFRDTENYSSYRLGAGLRIVPNATVSLEYVNYDVDMEAGPGDWNLDDDVIRLGLAMRF
jgi:hypothetical protein